MAEEYVGIKIVEDSSEVGYDSPSHNVAYYLGGNLVVTGTVSSSGGGESGPLFVIDKATLDTTPVVTSQSFLFPATGGHLALLDLAQSWSAIQTFTTKTNITNSTTTDFVLQAIVTTPAASGNYRAFWVETSTTAASMAASVFAIRGKTTLGAGSTSSGTSYIVGIQGRIDIAGTLGDSTWTAALYGQVGNTNPTLITGGRIHGLWIENDFTAFTHGVTAGGFSLVLLEGNATALLDSVFEIASVKAAYLFDLDDGSAGTWLQPLTTLTGAIIGRLKVHAPGQDYYIPLYES